MIKKQNIMRGKMLLTAATVAVSVLFVAPAFEMTANALSIGITAAPKKEVKAVVFKVGLHCQNCVKKVKENISFEKGVKSLEVSLENKTVTISYDPAKTDVATLKKAIEKLGYSATEVK